MQRNVVFTSRRRVTCGPIILASSLPYPKRFQTYLSIRSGVTAWFGAETFIGSYLTVHRREPLSSGDLMVRDPSGNHVLACQRLRHRVLPLEQLGMRLRYPLVCQDYTPGPAATFCDTRECCRRARPAIHIFSQALPPAALHAVVAQPTCPLFSSLQGVPAATRLTWSCRRRSSASRFHSVRRRGAGRPLP